MTSKYAENVKNVKNERKIVKFEVFLTTEDTQQPE